MGHKPSIIKLSFSNKLHGAIFFNSLNFFMEVNGNKKIRKSTENGF